MINAARDRDFQPDLNIAECIYVLGIPCYPVNVYNFGCNLKIKEFRFEGI